MRAHTRAAGNAMMGVLLALGLVVGCVTVGDSTKPIPTVLVPAPQKAERLVVVLPGRGDDLAGLKRSGVAAAIQGAWPDADVILAELAMQYYTDRQAPKRLHDEIIVPARQRGYRRIWLSGASLGGMGALIYDRHYPGSVDGMVLLAPFLGERQILNEITEAGGIERWDPGPTQIGGAGWQRDLWRHLQSWAHDPDKARNVWLVYGDKDRLRESMPVLEPLLPEQHVLVRRGGHSWTVWSPAMREVLARATRE